MADDYITSGEFGRFRVDFNARISELSDRMDSRFDGIDEKFDHLNGRTRTQAEAIVALDTKVQNIAARGCGKYDEHRKAIEGLVSIEPSPKRGWQNWHPAVKVGAGAGGMAVFATVMEVFSRILKYFGI